MKYCLSFPSPCGEVVFTGARNLLLDLNGVRPPGTEYRHRIPGEPTEPPGSLRGGGFRQRVKRTLSLTGRGLAGGQMVGGAFRRIGSVPERSANLWEARARASRLS